jgi:hypothetical protein
MDFQKLYLEKSDPDHYLFKNLLKPVWFENYSIL